jgi:glutamyl-tRNA reductase
MVSAGKSTDEAMEFLANTLTNRLLHAPTQALRQAAESAETVVAEALTRIIVDERDRQ